MCLLESPFIPLSHEKAQCQRMSQDKAAFGHMPNEEASKSFSDNPLTLLLGDFAHCLGNTILSLSSHFLLYQVRTYFLKGNSQCVHVLSHFSRVWLFVVLWTIAHQGSLSVGFSRQDYWSRLPFPSPGDLPKPGIKPVSPAFPALQVDFFTAEPPGKPVT